MKVTKKRIYALIAASLLVAVYFLYPIIVPPKLEFRERTFPQGFRDLVLESVSSPLDSVFFLKANPQAGPKLDKRAICDALFRDDDSPIAGRDDSELQIVSFFDYRCPYCKKLTPILSKVKSERIRVIYKEWPILGDISVSAARAALAANRQRKYLSFHTRLMNSRLMPTDAYVGQIAAELGMNLSLLRADMNSVTVTRALERTAALASALRLTGTPTLIVGRTIVQGEITQRQLERLIDVEIKQPEVPCKDL